MKRERERENNYLNGRGRELAEDREVWEKSSGLRGCEEGGRIAQLANLGGRLASDRDWELLGSG
ncbi:MAG: hypothetical protein ACI8TQ_001309 [Planctomycetota bacterium]|jgi:hypothetical protein